VYFVALKSRTTYGAVAYAQPLIFGFFLAYCHRIFTAAAALLVGSFTFTGPGMASEPKVVVTLKPIHSLVSLVMAGVGTPHLIVDGSASPHSFTVKPSGAKAINDAAVFFRVSEALEPFTHKLADSVPKTVKLVSLIDAPGLTVLPQRGGDTFEDHEDHDDAHADRDDEAGTKDGHIWLDPINAKAIVAHVAKVLSEAYPADAEKFAANASGAAAKIDALTAELTTLLDPVRGKPFVVFHDSTQYFERRFGVPAAGSITVTPDVQPSAKRLTAVRKKIASLNAVCVFAEPGFQPKLVDAVTGGTTARAATLDPEGVSLSAGPDMYFELMRSMGRSTKDCLAATE
jgi:zinc transport system substrate-binding protein